MTYKVDDVIARYVQLRDAKKEAEDAHKLLMEEKYNSKIEALENWLLQKLQEDGTDSVKSSSGTAFKKMQTSVSLADPEAFREHVMGPAVKAVTDYLEAVGAPVDTAHIHRLILEHPHWAVADLRVGKKGVQEFIEEHHKEVPGVDVTQVLTVNVRRA